jgi:VWFA-related protein
MSLRLISLAKRLVSVFLLVLPAVSQDSHSSVPPTAPAIQSGSTREVVLDVVVRDQSGNPVSNLSRTDFTILEDGSPQMMATFERPDQHRYTISAPDVKGTGRPGENSAPALTILVIDCSNAEVFDIAAAGVTKFLKNNRPKLPQPTALITVIGSQLELVHDYTEDAGALQNALERQLAELRMHPGPTPTGASDGTRLIDAFSCLEKIAAANMNFAGRKNVIWIGRGFPAIDFSKLNLAGVGGVAGADNDLRLRFTEAAVRTANEIWDARLAIYTLDPRGLQAAGIRSSESIATQTGGRMFFNRNDADVAMSTIVNDGSDYYTLSYYPKNDQWNEKFHSIRVTVSKPGIDARTRSGYYATAKGPQTDAKIESELASALENPLSYRGLKVSASYKVLSGTPRTARYTIDVDRHGLSWDAAPNGDRRCQIMALAMNPSGNDLADKDVKKLEETVKAGRFDKEMDDPMVFTFTDALPPDAGRVRVVVRDGETGKIGTADVNFGEPAASHARGR